MSALSDDDDELDAQLLAQATMHWQKVAMLIGKMMRASKTWDESKITERVVALVDSGKLESVGNIRNWRSSEIRLPQ